MATNLQSDNEEPEEENYNNNEQEYSDENTEESYEEVNKRDSSMTVYYVLAVVALLLTAGTAYYLNMDKNTYAVGSFNPLGFLKSKQDTNDIQNKLLPNSEDTTTNYSDPIEETSTSAPESIAPVSNKANRTSTKESISLNSANIVDAQSGRFYIIAGGFRSKRKAMMLVKKLIDEGQPAKLISPYDDKNMYRVSLNDFGAYDEANGQKQQLAASYGNELWILTY